MLSTKAVCMAVAVMAGCVGSAAGVGIATASIDLGNEWIKIGLVKPGVPMDIVLNADSKRKTEVIIGLKDNERSFGRAAVTVATKYPKNAYMYITELLGQQADSQVVKDWSARFPEHEVVPDPTRGTVTFKTEDSFYTVEELLAQIINYCIKCASDFAEQEINSITITTPAYFTQAQRKALLLVGDLAGVKILQLLNANTAVAINYGVFRLSKFNETTQNIMFYDMGATSTVATIVAYNTVVEKKGGKPAPQVAIKAVAMDRTLGGVEWTYRLRDHMMKKFLAYKKVKGRDVTKNDRAMRKLFFATQKTKTVLSANKATQCRVEGLFDEIDFKEDLSREDLEELTADLFGRVAAPITEALAQAEMKAEDLDQIIMFGGGWRIPKVQAIVKEVLGVEKLGMSINSDEAACLGASFKAATLTKSFRTPKFLIKDASMYPVQLQYDKPTPDGPEPNKRTKINLYTRLNAMPQKKIFRFKNMTSDFVFDIAYGNIDFLGPDQVSNFGKMQISTHNLSGVANTFQGHENDTDLGIKVHVEMDASGIVKVDRAYTVFEREVAPEPEPEPEKSTLESVADSLGLGDMLKNGTNGTNGTDEEPAAADGDAAKEGEKKEEETGKKEEKEEKKEGETEKKEEKEETKGEETEKKEEKEDKEEDKEEKKDGEEPVASATEANATEPVKEEPKPPPPPPKPIQLKEYVAVQSTVTDLLPQTDEDLANAQGRIQTLIDLERERVSQAAALNDLEGYIYKTRAQFEGEDKDEKIAKVTNESQREVVAANLSDAATWLDDYGWEANTTTLKFKLGELENAVRDIHYRANELKSRPRAVKKLKASLNSTLQLISRVRKMNNDSIAKNETLWITETEIDYLEQIFNETSGWYKNKTKEQKDTPPTESPAITVMEIKRKTDKLDREQLYLAKRPKPKPKKPKVKKNATNGTSGNGTKDANESVIDTGNATINEEETVSAGSGEEGGAEGAGEASADDAAAESTPEADAAKEDAAKEDAATEDAATEDAAKEDAKDEL